MRSLCLKLDKITFRKLEQYQHKCKNLYLFLTVKFPDFGQPELRAHYPILPPSCVVRQLGVGERQDGHSGAKATIKMTTKGIRLMSHYFEIKG